MRAGRLIDARKDGALLRVAVALSAQATCPRASVGALIVEPEGYRILATGYNGAPRGMSHCTVAGCDVRNNHCERAEHAELNALLNAASVGVAVRMGWAYVTHRPCWRCARALAQAGLQGVTYGHEYGTADERLIVLAEQTGLVVRRADGQARAFAGLVEAP